MTNPVAALGFSPYTGTTQQTNSSNATSNSPTATANTSNSLLDPQAFLKLLVAQLQYQDPSNPTDTSTFMNQTATLSQVQTMNSMDSTLTSLASAQQAQTATTMIGKQVTYVDGSGASVSGVVSSAQLLASGATLQVGANSVPLTSIVAVSAAPSTQT